MRYFGFVDAATGEYLEIQIQSSDKLQRRQGFWCGKRVVVSHELFRSFPAGDNAAVKQWFAALTKVELPEFTQLELVD